MTNMSAHQDHHARVTATSRKETDLSVKEAPKVSNESLMVDLWHSYQRVKSEKSPMTDKTRNMLAHSMAVVTQQDGANGKAEVFASANDIVHQDPELHALYFAKISDMLDTQVLEKLQSYHAEKVRLKSQPETASARDIADAGARARALLSEYAAQLNAGQQGTQTLDALLVAATEEAVAHRHDSHPKTLQKQLATNEAYADQKFYTLKFRLEDSVRSAIEKAELNASGVLDILDVGERCRKLFDLYDASLLDVQNLTLERALVQAAVDEQRVDGSLRTTQTLYQRINSEPQFNNKLFRHLKLTVNDAVARDLREQERFSQSSPVKQVEATDAAIQGRATETSGPVIQ